MADDKRTITLTKDNFEARVLASDRPVLVDFWADWCAPCHQVAPIVEEIAAEYEGRLTVGKVNVDDEVGLARRYGIRSIPSLLLFGGGTVIDQIVGVHPKEEIASRLEALV